MIKTLLVVFGICLLSVTADAKGGAGTKGGGKGDHPPSEMKELLKKYDKNKDGKLDESERASMTKADKDKLEKLRDAKK